MWPGGIYRVERAALNAVAEGTTNHLACVLYGEADGMSVAATSGENQPSCCRGTDGRLYFSTPIGLAVIDPRTADADPPPPPVFIEQVLVDDEVVFGDGIVGVAGGVDPDSERSDRVEGISPSHSGGESSARMRFGPGGARSLRFRYTANALTAPERVRFERRLEGLEGGWQEGSADRTAYFARLNPGRYCFRVRAANHRGVWNEQGAAFAFVVAPYLWQTWPFRIFAIGVAVGATVAFLLWRLAWQRRVLLIERRLALDRERNRIARDMHDDLGAQLSALALTLSATASESAF